MRFFATTGICNPEKHYMVDISERLREMETMIDRGEYFTIKRSRQFGKTTTIVQLKKYLDAKYEVISLDFQKLSAGSFKSEETFVKDFCKLIIGKTELGLRLPDSIDKQIRSLSEQEKVEKRLIDLFFIITKWCANSDKEPVLIIDEVDSATNNQVFLDFLAQLRDGYIARESEGAPAIKSVILAGVTDVKHIKSKIRDDDQHKVNSPWNTREGNETSESLLSFGDCSRDQMAAPFDIAVDFNIDMSFSAEDICGMLKDYEGDHHTGMQVDEVAQYIRDYTSGYPFLVSKLCSIIDNSNGKFQWSIYGIDEAVKLLLKEENVTLFDSLMGKLTNYPVLKEKLYRILMNGEVLEYLPYDEAQKQLRMYGFIKEQDGVVVISNRIFETLLYNHFLGENNDYNDIKQTASYEKNMFVRDGALDVKLILERFIVAYNQIFGELEDRFKEKDGREIFLLFLKPIINGTGNYYIEARTRDQRRTDVIIDYLGKQYIIEMKIWRGERYNSEGEKQISDYLEYFGLDTGYMLSFNFNKKKEQGVKEVIIGKKKLIEGMV